MRPLEELCLLLRCPGCLTTPLRAAPAAVVCPDCGARFSADGYVDLGPAENAPAGGAGRWRLAPRLMHLAPLAAVYERWWRPAFVGALSLWSVPFESEWFIARTALGLGERPGPWLDLSCGPGLYTRRLAAAAPDEVVVGLDLSRAMLGEAVAGRPADSRRLHLVRGDVHALPFRDGAFTGINNGAALHLYADPARAVREAWRVLAPGGVYVASTVVWAAGLLQPVMKLAGTKLWRPGELRRLVTDAGFIDYGEARLRGATVLRARRP